MPPVVRLLLAGGTLGLFWVALFVSDAVNSGTADTAPVSAPASAAAPAAADNMAHEKAAKPDAAALDAALVASREAFSTERWQDALVPTETIVKHFPGQHVYLARLAEIYNKLERPKDEAATWELYMDRAPLPAEACPAIGYAYRRLDQGDKVLDAFERCYQSDTKNPELAFFAGLANEWLSRFDQAQQYYDRAIAIATTHHDSEVGLARLQLHRDKLSDALARATAVLRKVPTHVDALLVAGLAEQRAGRRVEARRHLERAAGLSNDYFDVHLALGVLDYSEARYPSARKRFEHASKLDPRRSEEIRPWLERTSGARSAS